MSESARDYQSQVTGAPEGYAYRVKSGDKEVDFDGFDQAGLIEAKGPGYEKWVDKDLSFVEFFEGRLQMLDQAKRQFKAAKGASIRWIVVEEKLAGALRKMFEAAGLPIPAASTPPLLDG
jgi:hypothetical protein